MKFNFRKITSIFASAVMLGSTVGLAAAASYPAPFVSGGAADVAVVVGASAASSDFLAAVDVGQSLQAELAKQTATTGTSSASTSGETSALSTSSSRLWINDTLNNVKNVVTKAELKTLLKDGSFSGNVDATYTQTIEIGATPRLSFSKMPTSSDDPTFGYTLNPSGGTSSATNYFYNTSVTFNKAVNVTHADSKNQELSLLGQKFTIGAATDSTNLVLLKEATKVTLDSSGSVSEEVTVGGKKYTIELVSASSTTATVKVTNDAGTSDSKEITEGYSKKINGVTIAVNTADSNNLKYTASLVAGAEKITLTSGSSVTYGDDDSVMDGTRVTLTGGTTALTKIVVTIYATNSDKDALKVGDSFKDPLFGTFKIDFAGLNIADDSTTAREDIKIKSSGDDKMTLEMTDYLGNTKTTQFAMNKSDAIYMHHDSDGHRINVAEREASNRSDMIVVGNEDEGHLVKVSQIVNQTTGYSQDKVTFADVFTGDTYTSTLTAEGTGTVTIGGKVFNVNYFGDSSSSEDARTVRLNYPDSSATTDMVIYPTIQTSKGAKVFFYQPLNITLDGWDGSGTSLAGGNIKVPNGADTYQDLAVLLTGNGNFTIGGNAVNRTTGAGGQSSLVAITNTGLSYNFTHAGTNMTKVFLTSRTSAGAYANIVDPAIVVIEEKDDNNQYQAIIVTLEPGLTGDDGIGVNTVFRTWGPEQTEFGAHTLATDSKKQKEADLWGAITLLDQSDSDQNTASISYPEDQVYAQVYVGIPESSVTAASTATGTVTELGSVTVKDSEVSQVESKNLLVIGGSCINTAAQKILGESAALCGAGFTTKTGVGADQAIIKVVKSPYLDANTTKIAMLVAGYEAADTTKAAKYLTTSKPSTAVGEIKLSTSGTVATVATAAAA